MTGAVSMQGDCSTANQYAGLLHQSSAQSVAYGLEFLSTLLLVGFSG